jgi:glycosyltransferase involved in cell wall biosynthesis
MNSGPAMPVLVHDYLLVHRGAERSFVALCDLFPGAPVATLLFDPAVFGQRLAGHPVRTSRLQRLGARQSTFKALLPALPCAAERLPVGDHDLVISSSSAFAHGVRPDAGATHVCYCYTPFRYAWYERDVALAQVPAPLRRPLGITLDRIKRWDRAAASRGTHYVAISQLSRERIERYWGVDAPVVHPPVELDRFRPRPPEDFVLVVCELVRHKRVDLALEAARRSRTPIKVVGGGADEARLKERYSDHAEFLGRLGDAELAALYSRARALVMPNTEEFGITSVEAQASGRPVLAAAAGGATETVIDGKTGFLLPVGDVDALTEAMGDPALDRLEPAACIANAQRFSVRAFGAGMLEQIERARATRA